MPRTKKRKYSKDVEDDPKLTVMKPLVVLKPLAKSIASPDGEQGIQGDRQGYLQEVCHDISNKCPPSLSRTVTPIKLTKLSDVLDKVKRLEKVIDAKDIDNEVLREKVFFLEDELCKKNARIKELEEKLMAIDDKSSRDLTNEENTTAEENETTKEDDENLNDSIEFLLQCKAIAKRGAEGLLKVKLEPAEGGTQFEEMFKDLENIRTPRKDNSVEAISLNTSSLFGNLFDTPAEVVKTRRRKKSVIASLASGPCKESPVVSDSKKGMRRKPSTKSTDQGSDSPAAKTMSNWLAKGGPIKTYERKKRIEEESPSIKVRSFAKVWAGAENVMSPK